VEVRGEVIQALRIAWFRFRANFRHRFTGLLTIVVLIGTIGGLALASVAGARRTESSFPTYFASTSPSTVGVVSSYDDPGLDVKSGFNPRLVAKISKLPLVTRTTTTIIFDGNINLHAIKGLHSHVLAGETPPSFVGSTNGDLSTMDRVTFVKGIRAIPTRMGEAVMNAEAASEMGVHIGSVIEIPFYTDSQVNAITSPRHIPKPYRLMKIKLVGEFVLSANVVESDIDALGSSMVIFSPALTRALETKCTTGTEVWLQLRGGTSSANKVASQIYRIDPDAQDFGGDQVTATILPAVQQAIEPEAIALGTFGGIAGLAVLLIVALMIARLLRVEAEETRTLRALGATRASMRADQLIGVLGAFVLGAAIAVAVAFALSSLSPLGPVRPVYPRLGVTFDATVLGLGFLLLIVPLSVFALITSNRELRRITVSSSARAPKREPGLVRASANAGLPISTVTGVRFALESGEGRSATPVRSAIVGTVLAVTILVTTLTFGASLNGLVSRPSLYGWNWNYAILSGFAGAEDMPGPQSAAILNKDPDVQSWSGVFTVGAKLDGQDVGMLTESPGAAVAPPILSGHGLDKGNQVVIGSTTLALLHKHVGDSVTFNNGVSKPKSLLIVGTATMPAIEDGIGMGAGALVATSDFPRQLLNVQHAPVYGPNAILVRTRPGITPSAAYRSLLKVNREINAVPIASGLAGGVVTVLRPVEIVNFHSMGTTPTVFAACLALGAIAALGITLGASVRRRRRDLALLKALGFRQRQLASAIAWQSSVAACFGALFGIPLGIVIGRELWILFARSINAVPSPTVPVSTVVVVALGTVVFANLVAAIPGRVAARTSTALVLRTE
jgi:hypothetical protein